ncbi:hypothetical protein LPJ75_006913, partial [Coemansia sp. RSA 2598]
TILNIQPKPKFSVLGAAVARLFVAHPDTSKWTYTRRFGALVLVKDTHNNDASFLRIVNLGSSGQAVLWEQELYRGFELVKQAPFFFTVAGDKHVFGLDFADVDEAAKFEEKVKKRARKIMKQSAAAAAAATASGPSATQRMLGLDDDKYRKLVKALAAYNITENMLDDANTAKLIKDFVNQNGSVDNLIRSVHPRAPSQAPPPPPPPPTNAPPPPPPGAPPRSPAPAAHSAGALPARSPVMRTASPHHAPPPPPPPPSRRNAPPPPPPRHRPPPPQPKSTP